MIAPLVPAVIARAPGSGVAAAGPPGPRLRPLPLAVLGPDVTLPDGTVYALSAVDRSGRVADRGILAELGWPRGTLLDTREHAGTINLRVADDGRSRVDGRGYLILALSVRRWCRLRTGDRLLLVADARAGVLTGYPLPVLHRLLEVAAGDGGGRDEPRSCP